MSPRMSPFEDILSPSPAAPALALSEIISALSFALDLTEGAVPGHALRCCLLGMRIAKAMNVDRELLVPLYYALQLKDIGCSSNASRMTQLVGGDDRATKSVAKLADWTRVFRIDTRTLRTLWRHVLPSQKRRQRLRRLLLLGLRQTRNNREMIGLRCERGSAIVRKLELGERAAEAVHRLDEHWDGSGYPSGLRGEAIPLLSRLCTVAQHLDCFAMADGVDTALNVLRKRSGTWFDPAIVRAAAALHHDGKLWTYCRPECPVEVTRRAVVDLDPGRSRELAETALTESRIDTICEAFADVVDAKSPFTYRHSLGVAEVAEAIARELGLTADRILLVRRAALLHDLGKLGVPNTILDKNGALTAGERGVVQEHPFLTRTILERITSFEELAVIAGEHHEKLDGSGYPSGLAAAALRLESRIIGVADCFAALAEDRPYRKAAPVADILTELRREVPGRLDEVCFEALITVTTLWNGTKPKSLTAVRVDDLCYIRPRPHGSQRHRVRIA